MKTDSDIWLTEKAVDVLKEIGIKEGQIILDFGCGAGYYTIPVAKIAGDNGKVYALDKDGNSLDELKNKAKEEKVKNIEIIKTSGEIKIPFEDNSIDVILLYDVIHSYYFSDDERKKVVDEAKRVLKVRGMLSLYPKHMNLEEIKCEIEKEGFYLEKRIFTTLLHYYSLTDGYILNFRRR